MNRRAVVRALKKILPDSVFEGLRHNYRRMAKAFVYCVWFPAVYRLSAREPVQDNLVMFIELHDQNKISDNYQLIWEKLSEHGTYDPELFILNKPKGNEISYYKRCAELTARAARARYIFVDDAFQVFGHVPIRRETGIYNVWHACGAFKRFGFGTAELKFGGNRKTQEKYPNYTFCTEFYVSSPEVVSVYAESTGLPAERVIPAGVSRTDIFFRDSFVTGAREKISRLFPQSAGKKIILYAPTFRGRVAEASAPDQLSVPMFHNALSDEYVLVVKHHPFVKDLPEIRQEDRDFAADLTNSMSIEELLCAADICISDYSSVIFEYSLFLKPMVFYAYDQEEYDEWRGFYYDYSEMTPGPVFTTNEDMLDYIQHVDEKFDVQEVIRFRDRFMSSCDGHVTERLIDRIFGEARENKASCG